MLSLSIYLYAYFNLNIMIGENQMNKTVVIGGSESFRLFLKSIDENIVFEEDLNKAITNYEYTSIIILPEYDKGIEFIKPFSTDIIETLAKRKKVS